MQGRDEDFYIMAEGISPFERLQRYIEKTKKTPITPDIDDTEEDYEARVTKSLKYLQNQVTQHQEALEQVHFYSFAERLPHH